MIRGAISKILPLTIKKIIRRNISVYKNIPPNNMSDEIYNDILNTNNTSKKISILHSYGINIFHLDENCRNNIINCLSGNPEAIQETYKLFSNIDSNELSFYSWLSIYDLYRRIGLYSTGLVFRDKALKKMISLNPKNLKKNQVRYFISGNLELNQIQGFNDFCKIINQLKISEKEKNYWIIFGSFWYEGAHDIDLKQIEYSELYANEVKDKTIAIVCPSESSNLDAGEIDLHDRVIRLNYSVKGKSCDHKYKGLRSDITYFMKEHGNSFFINEGGLLPNDLKWACFKDLSHSKRAESINSRIKVRTMSSEKWRDKSFHASYNGIQNILLDLLIYKPKLCKIYHSDMFLTLLRAKGYTPKTMGNNDLNYRILNINKAYHDPVANHIFMKRLYQLGKIEVDTILRDVLEMETANYCKKLEDTYSQHTKTL